MAKRFASHVDEIIEKRAKSIPDNTQNANKKAANILRAYLQEKQEDYFEHFYFVKLNEVLRHFYLDAKNVTGHDFMDANESYKTALNELKACSKDLHKPFGLYNWCHNPDKTEFLSSESLSSPAIYHRVSDDEKVQMDQAVTSAIRGPNKMPARHHHPNHLLHFPLKL
ncbi:hypothetical protein KUTeg_017230 [Tegillarca granosa]|uniref:Uncharacterized protein n=1 Tax=Tegillarca granosa TaxID=220873 RepID=A0ABQ9EIX3_TEGGR|nr:hypothetical protein KUTeg_017230 [Tegillarca granosa]